MYRFQVTRRKQIPQPLSAEIRFGHIPQILRSTSHSVSHASPHHGVVRNHRALFNRERLMGPSPIVEPMKQSIPFVVAVSLLVLVLFLIWLGIVPLTDFGLSIYVVVLIVFYAVLLHGVAHYLVDAGPKAIVFAVVAFATSSALLILLFAFAWSAFGGFGPSSGTAALTSVDAVYFSAVTFTTVGFGDFLPTTTSAKLLVSFEALLGSSHMVAFFSVLLLRVKHAQSCNRED